MQSAQAFLLRRLPYELVAKIDALTHDLGPVMQELLCLHPITIPQIVITTNSFRNLRRLRMRYKDDIFSVSHCKNGCITKIDVEIGKCDSLSHIRRYRYVRRPRWNPTRQQWRELGVLI